ncbi:MAG: hypothetical protein AB1405_14555, partial [Bdellovibrionota bacterium]
DAAGDAAGFQAAPAAGALSGEAPSPAEVPEDDPFAALGEPSPAGEGPPAAAVEEPQAAGEDAFSALDEAAPPPPPLNTAPVPLASSPPTEYLGDSSEAGEPQVPAAEAPAALEAPPAEEEVIDAADEYLDSGAAAETPEPEGMMAEAERIAREVASEPAPEPPPPPVQEPPPTEPTMAVQYAHDDAQYLEGLSDEAPPSAPAEEPITDAEDYMKESAGAPPAPAAEESKPPSLAAESQPEAAASEEVSVPLEAEEEEKAGSAEASAAAAEEPVPAGESTPLPPVSVPAKPEAPRVSGESFVDITGDDDIRRALEDAGGIVMTPVDPSEMPARPSGALKQPPPAVAAPKPPPPGEAPKAPSVKWVPFTKESSDELKAAAKKVPVSERSADKLVFSLKLQVKFPPDGSELQGRLCVYQKRPALLVDGETEPRVLTKECFFSYL